MAQSTALHCIRHENSSDRFICHFSSSIVLYEQGVYYEFLRMSPKVVGTSNEEFRVSSAADQ